ncbi:hypothetical protein [Shewanella frigidimarina]|uniref:hypothetical protein n=1 Tax=Shewanella frigidimarina TaxID=56812 RepID=UPI003D7AB0A7
MINSKTIKAEKFMLLISLIRQFKVIMLLLITSSSSFALERPNEIPIMLLGETEVYSIVNDPDYIVDDDSMIKIWDGILTYAHPKLTPIYQHMSLTRSWVEISKIPNACMINKIKNTERESIGIFSKYPFSIFPPIRLIALEKNQFKFKQPFSLAELHKQNIQIGVAKSRSYGYEIDKFIKQNPEYFFIRGAEDSMSKLIDMLMKERIDAIIDFSQIVIAHKLEMAQLQPIISIPLSEAPEPILSYVVCSKSDQGQAIIDIINESYQTQEVKEIFQRFHYHYFGEKELALLQPIIDGIFLSPEELQTQGEITNIF